MSHQPKMNDSDSHAVPLFEGKYLRFLKSGNWEYVERRGSTGAVAVVAVTDQGKLVFAEQFRKPVHRSVIELPAGLVGDVEGGTGESLEIAAHRELLEETGYEAGKMVCLGEGTSSPGLASEIVVFFRATGLRKVHSGGGDPSEAIRVHEVPLAQMDEWLRRKAEEGLLIDLKIYSGLYLFQRV